MNKTINFRPYLFLALAVLVILSLPKAVTTTLRGKAASWVAPLWNGALVIKNWVVNSEKDRLDLRENAVLLENSLLKGEIARLQELLFLEVSLESDLAGLKNLSYDFDKEAFFRRRYDELQRVVDLKLNGVHAEVVYRGFSTWNHTCHINVGKKTNQDLGRLVVQKNSPVTLGNSIIGVVDEVYDNFSLVRLITDPGLHPSVRVSRGYGQNRDLIEHINFLSLALNLRQGLLPNGKDQEILKENLEILKKNLTNVQGSLLLAKGELAGLADSKFKNSEVLLRGIGFNYDFSDSEGLARDLRTGKTSLSKTTILPLIQVGDLLITTGMDGVFPAGLHAAEVVSIDVLKEGAYAYDILARSTAKNIDEVKHVFVLPPLIAH
jgi:rod shape-determining protein MreC